MMEDFTIAGGLPGINEAGIQGISSATFSIAIGMDGDRTRRSARILRDAEVYNDDVIFRTVLKTESDARGRPASRS